MTNKSIDDTEAQSADTAAVDNHRYPDEPSTDTPPPPVDYVDLDDDGEEAPTGDCEVEETTPNNPTAVPAAPSSAEEQKLAWEQAQARGKEKELALAVDAARKAIHLYRVPIEQVTDTDDAVRMAYATANELKYSSATDTWLSYEPPINRSKRRLDRAEVEDFEIRKEGRLVPLVDTTVPEVQDREISAGGHWSVLDTDTAAKKLVMSRFHRVRERIKGLVLDEQSLSLAERRALGGYKKSRGLHGHVEGRLDARGQASVVHVLRALTSGANLQDFDAERTHYLLNVKNGTIDLRTGILRPHDKGDYITRIIPIPFDPAAQCPVFMQMLSHITSTDVENGQPGDPVFMAYFARMLGYLIQGTTKENKFFLWYDPVGGAGKGTLLELLQWILGQYAVNVEVHSFTAAGAKAIRDDLARCKGVRLIQANEVDRGQQLAESLIKKLASGDRISVDAKYANTTEFAWTGKLVTPCQYLPGIKGVDQAIWDRPEVVPFLNRFRGTDRQDKDVMSKLKAEAPGILAFLVRGCLGWQGRGEYAWVDGNGVARPGLHPPPQVVEATAQYRESQTGLGAWKSACATATPGHFTSTSDFYDSHQSWAARNSQPELSYTDFSRRLKAFLGGDSTVRETRLMVDGKKLRGWVGLSLNSDHPGGSSSTNAGSGLNEVDFAEGIDLES